MSDWLKKIKGIISQSDNESLSELDELDIEAPESSMLDELDYQPKSLLSQSHLNKQKASSAATSIRNNDPSSSQSNAQPKEEEKEKEMNSKQTSTSDDDNLKALKRLRELPRGTQVDSRIAAIENLLGEKEIFKTLNMLRWPQGIVCPTCRSTNVVRKDPPPSSTDQRHYYVCLNCKEKEDGDGSGTFDDFTGLPIKSIYALRQWILCWYLIGFCSVMQIAKVLGISPQEVIQIASLGNDLTLLADAELSASKSAQQRKEKQSDPSLRSEDQEERTRSESKAPLKPGYKSKK